MVPSLVIYVPGHTENKYYERAYRLANGAAPFGDLILSVGDVLFSLNQDAKERRQMDQSMSMDRLQVKRK